MRDRHPEPHRRNHHAVRAGRNHLDGAWAAFQRLAASAEHAPALGALTRRQQQTLACLLQGDSEKQAAARLGLSRHTVHDHVKELHRRLGVASRGELLARFVYAEAPEERPPEERPPAEPGANGRLRVRGASVR